MNKREKKITPKGIGGLLIILAQQEKSCIDMGFDAKYSYINLPSAFDGLDITWQSVVASINTLPDWCYEHDETVEWRIINGKPRSIKLHHYSVTKAGKKAAGLDDTSWGGML